MATFIILFLVTAERLAELVYARRNTQRLIARGGREIAPGHYPFIVVIHAAWLGGLWLLAWGEQPDWSWLMLFLVLQVARLWVLGTLGRRWTMRIIIVPGETLVRSGPYRFMAHPNYAVVAGEIAVLPLVFGLWAYALAFSVLNAFASGIRIRAENAALAKSSRLSRQAA